MYVVIQFMKCKDAINNELPYSVVKSWRSVANNITTPNTENEGNILLSAVKKHQYIGQMKKRVGCFNTCTIENTL